MGSVRIASAFAMFFLSWSAGVAAYEETRTLHLPADGLNQLSITCGSGSLTVNGRESADNISVEAEIVIEHAGSEEALELIEDHMTLSLERRGDRAVLVSEFDDVDWGFWSNLFHDIEVRIDLIVDLPSGFAVDIEDGSGEITIENLGAVAIDDGSGDIAITGVKTATVNDGSGDLAIMDAGDIIIDDDSGDVALRDITGTVEIEDGSGNVTLVNVQDRVRVDDGAGDIEVRDAGGDVVIDDASGNIVLVGISGDVRIDDASGDIRIEDVDGGVEVRDGSGSIVVRRVARDLVVREDGSGEIVIEDVEGSVRTPD